MFKQPEIRFWYPNPKLESQVTGVECEDLPSWLSFLNSLGLNVIVSKSFAVSNILYVDTRIFTQR